MVDYRVRTFLQLYETMNYRRTAELLRLSQPAVSQQIHSLEGEYGCKLFVYDGRRLHRTEQADQVAAYARSALYNEQQLLRELKKLDKVAYIRFASVYRDFSDVDSFLVELKKLQEED